MKTSVKTPYGELTVQDNGEVYQNGQKLDQRDEMYDADTNLSVCISPHVNVYAKGSLYSKRVHMDDLVEKAGYVQGNKNGMKTPAILHKDHDKDNYASNNLEWVEKTSQEYVEYQKDENAQKRKRNVELNPGKTFPDFLQPKP